MWVCMVVCCLRTAMACPACTLPLPSVTWDSTPHEPIQGQSSRRLMNKWKQHVLSKFGQGQQKTRGTMKCSKTPDWNAPLYSLFSQFWGYSYQWTCHVNTQLKYLNSTFPTMSIGECPGCMTHRACIDLFNEWLESFHLVTFGLTGPFICPDMEVFHWRHFHESRVASSTQ